LNLPIKIYMIPAPLNASIDNRWSYFEKPTSKTSAQDKAKSAKST